MRYGEVKWAFDKFDKDKSGSIDKEELKDLCKEIGFPINDEQCDLALKDLDLNRDGVIDISEFSRWYFTGMKQYSKTKRTMLKLQNNTNDLFNALAESASKSYGGQLKTKTSSIKIAFNEPEA